MTASKDNDDAPRVVERAAGRNGELALRAVGHHFEIVSNGVFLMDTRDGRSERLLVDLALRHAPPRARVLIGGLGVGFSLAQALRSDRVAEATVVEIEPRIVAWGRTHLAPFSGNALADPRTRIVADDLAAWLVRSADTFDAICLDVDNGPSWTVADGNWALYSDEGLALLRRRLGPSGVVTIWSAAAEPAFEARLRGAFATVEVVAVPVARGEPDVVYVAAADAAKIALPA